MEEVRQRNDIVDVISSCVHLKHSGNNYTGLCPFHNEKTASFSVSQSKQMYYCFGCGAGGNVFTFVMEYENLTFVEALEYLANRAGMELPAASQGADARRKRDEKDKILEVYKVAAKFYFAMLQNERGRVAREYLAERQIKEETIRSFGLGYSDKFGGLYNYIRKQGYEDDLLRKTGLFTYDEKRGVSDKFWNRVMYPIMDRSNHVIAFGGRVMGDGKPKYLNSPETVVFDKSRNLYGLNYVHGKCDGLIICEGYMDVIALHQAGFTNAVASLGTAFTSQHSSLIKRYTDKVYLCYDSDGAGVKAARRAIPMLREAGLSIRVINMRPYKDPDELIKNTSAEEFQKRIDEAKNSFFYEIEMLEKEYDMNDPEDKTKFMNEAAKKCLSFENELERDNYVEAFARLYEIRKEDFRQLVNKMAAKMVGLQYQPKTASHEKNQKEKKEDAYLKAQRIMLTWLVDKPQTFARVGDMLSEKDFIEEPYKTVAKMLYEQYRESGKVEPAKIISFFQSKEEQTQVASLFNTSITQISKEDEMDKALNEVVRRVKQLSLDYQSRNLTDLNELTRIIEEKKKLEKWHL